MVELFVRDRGRIYGPCSPAHIKRLATAGRISPAWSIGKTKDGPWVTAGSICALFPAVDTAPAGRRPSPGGAAKRSVRFTKLQWAIVIAGSLLPWLVAAACSRPAAAAWFWNRTARRLPAATVPATGWYLDDLPDAVQQSKRQGKNLLVVFTADWCGPCRRLKQDLARAERLRRDLLVCVVDLDRQRALADLHGVQGIPDLRLFRQGEQVKHATGYGGSIADLTAWVRER